MPPTKHAKLNASSAHRWLNCPGSVEFSTFYKSPETFYTKEGSLAHELAEVMIKKSLGKKTQKDVNLVTKRVKSFYERYPDKGDPMNNVKELKAYVKEYVDWVLEEYASAVKEDPGAVIFLETLFELEPFIPEGFGTADVTIIYGDVLHIIDLKFGRGVLVDAYDNPQLMIYALGVLHDVAEMLGINIKTVRMSINQPRRDHISTWEVYTDDLEAWAEDVLKPKAFRAFYETGLEHVPGDWCMFCPAKEDCIARMAHFEELAEIQQKYFDVNALSPDDVARVLASANSVVSFIESVKKKALADGLDGSPPPGYKVVAGIAKRRFNIPENEVAAIALKAGAPREELYETKLISLTKIEKLLKKSTFEQVFAGKVSKTSGSPVLAPESDKRPAFDSVESDFEEDIT